MFDSEWDKMPMEQRKQIIAKMMTDDEKEYKEIEALAKAAVDKALADYKASIQQK